VVNGKEEEEERQERKKMSQHGGVAVNLFH